MNKGPLERYQARITAGEMQNDPAQFEVATKLDDLALALHSWRPRPLGRIAQMFSSRADAPRGLYIHGAVGRGKTMLMDMFYAAVDVTLKRRVHFHEFMGEVHELLAEARHTVEGDPLAHVAQSIVRRSQLLCFDEMHVTDVADAMILSRLFKKLFDAQVVVVATSNAAPRELYKNGLQRDNFLSFIALLEQQLDVVELGAAKDYRLDRLSGLPLYFSPLNEPTRKAMRSAFTRLTGVWKGPPAQLDVKGRILQVPEAARGVARFTFADLCAQPLGAADYLSIARSFHTVLIESIPLLTPDKRNEARRFINLIDTLYDNRIGLIASAEVEPHELYVSGDGADLFARTASRLMEMRSQSYLEGRGQRLV